jgi:hypothetical protein
MKITYAPDRDMSGPLPRVFLAGSIEMGKAEDWQAKLAEALEGADVTLLNPRRKDWDSSWVQVKENKQFNEQVTWELSRMDLANIIVYWFVPGTVSPVTMLELGLHLRDGTAIIVGCPEGFQRKGNIDIVADRYGVAVYETWESFVAAVRDAISSYHKYT